MNVKLLLLKDKEGFGKKGDIVEVSKGYARNFLLPQGFAKIASDTDLALALQRKQAHAEEQVEVLKNIEEIKKRLSKKRISIRADASRSGTLYSAVSSDAIVKELYNTYGVQIDVESIKISAVKSIGLHKFKIDFKDKGYVEMQIKVIDKEY